MSSFFFVIFFDQIWIQNLEQIISKNYMISRWYVVVTYLKLISTLQLTVCSKFCIIFFYFRLHLKYNTMVQSEFLLMTSFKLSVSFFWDTISTFGSTSIKHFKNLSTTLWSFHNLLNINSCDIFYQLCKYDDWNKWSLLRPLSIK